MKIKVDFSVLAETKWHEYAVRFLFGGLVTASAGIIAKAFGPVVGGLFLAFPAIFPASATLIEKHEKQKKERLGLTGALRAANAVSVDAAGVSDRKHRPGGFRGASLASNTRPFCLARTNWCQSRLGNRLCAYLGTTPTVVRRVQSRHYGA